MLLLLLVLLHLRLRLNLLVPGLPVCSLLCVGHRKEVRECGWCVAYGTKVCPSASSSTHACGGRAATVCWWSHGGAAARQRTVLLTRAALQGCMNPQCASIFAVLDKLVVEILNPICRVTPQLIEIKLQLAAKSGFPEHHVKHDP